MKKASLFLAAACLVPSAILSGVACTDPPAPKTPPAASAPPPSTAPSASVVASAPAPLDIEPKPAPETLLAEKQLTALTQASDALNAHDVNRYLELFTKNVIHKEAAAQDIRGRNEMSMRMGLLFRAFPDLKFQFERVWQKDSVAVATWRWTGTDGGGYIERKPSGRRAGLTGVTVGFFNADGQIREVHLYQDGVTVASQLDPKAKAGSFRAAPEDPTGARPRAVASTNSEAEVKVLAASKAVYGALETRDKAALAGMVTDDFTVEDLAAPPHAEKGKAAVNAMIDDWQKTFGAWTELPLYNHVVVGDTAIVERVLSGTMAGKPVKLHALDIGEYKDGKLVKLTVYSDTLELWHQAGPKAHR
jgi:steroid delta-isomerase-like uncharacterized protein